MPIASIPKQNKRGLRTNGLVNALVMRDRGGKMWQENPNAKGMCVVVLGVRVYVFVLLFCKGGCVSYVWQNDSEVNRLNTDDSGVVIK